MHRNLSFAFSLCLCLSACDGGSVSNSTIGSDAQLASDPGETHPYPDYRSEVFADLSTWLCHPDLESGNACDANLDARVVEADGSFTIRPYAANKEAEVDCVYFLPTTSLDPTPNADFNPDVQEKRTAESQFGPYGEACRQFAPLYRQMTLTTLAVNVVAGQVLPVSLNEEAREIAYVDVLDAYRHYMANFNGGRGYILVGHSQGSGHLRRLIAEEIEPNDYLHRRMISAHLLGTTVAIPHNARVGASFQRTPACEAANQTHCVVSYATYREGDPELAEPRFAITADENTRAVCTNPAALMGGEAALDAYLPYSLPPAYATLTSFYNRGTGGPYDDRVQNLVDSAETAYFQVPGQIRAECVLDENIGTHYLQIRIEADPDDPRADDYPAEFAGGTGWGMHIADVNLALGDLVRLAQMQAASWLADSAGR